MLSHYQSLYCVRIFPFFWWRQRAHGGYDRSSEYAHYPIAPVLRLTFVAFSVCSTTFCFSLLGLLILIIVGYHHISRPSVNYSVCLKLLLMCINATCIYSALSSISVFWLVLNIKVIKNEINKWFLLTKMYIYLLFSFNKMYNVI